MSIEISLPGDGEKIVAITFVILLGFLLAAIAIHHVETGTRPLGLVFGTVVLGGIASAGCWWYGCRLARINANEEVTDKAYLKIRDYCRKNPESQKALRAWVQERGREAIVWSEVGELVTVLLEADTKSARGSVLSASVSQES